MRAAATLRTVEAEALALRMRRHFGHKVPVEVEGRVSRVRIPAGEFELEPTGDGLDVRVRAADATDLARVREVVGAHLARFARETDVVLAWDGLEVRAEEWLRGHRTVRHLMRARDWVCTLAPDAGEAARLAALLHDVDRDRAGVPVGDQVASWDDERAVAGHAERAAAIAGAWLRAEGADAGLVRAVEELIRLHEVGGTPEADLVQAADSLAFLEANPVVRWVREGLADAEAAEGKLRLMHDRIRLGEARAPARTLLERALAALVSEAPVLQDSPLAERKRQDATEGRAHGNTR